MECIEGMYIYTKIAYTYIPSKSLASNSSKVTEYSFICPFSESLTLVLRDKLTRLLKLKKR